MQMCKLKIEQHYKIQKKKRRERERETENARPCSEAAEEKMFKSIEMVEPGMAKRGP